MKHKFVEFIPEKLEEGVIYVAMEFGAVAHKCSCGCGNEVYTPLSPTDWKLTYDGESITLYPSIGNWGFDCESHYWIINNKVKWSGKWTEKEIQAGRKRDKLKKQAFYRDEKPVPADSMPDAASDSPGMEEVSPRPGFWTRVKKWFL